MNIQTPILRADNATRRFRSPGGDVVAVHDVSFELTAGKIAGLVGRSGSGKTTLLTLIGMLDTPDEGDVQVLGQSSRLASTDTLAKWRRGRIGYLFQDSGLIERARVIDSVTLPLRYAGVARSERIARAEAALETVELADKTHRRVGQLSGGERQRVGLARALALDPQVLVCDEPTAPLDAITSRTVAMTLRAFADRGRCVVVATHDPIVMEILDVTITLERGRRCT